MQPNTHTHSTSCATQKNRHTRTTPSYHKEITQAACKQGHHMLHRHGITPCTGCSPTHTPGKYGRVHLTAWHKRCVRGYLHIGYLAYPYHHLHTQKTEVICIEMPGTFVLFWGLSVTRTVVSGTLLPSLAVACAHCAL
jgi:hypothetical protein